MKTKNTELDVDFIGGQSALTQAEEKALSEFFSQRKIATKTKKVKQSRSSQKKEKVLA
jgi:hypothetical protein